MELALFTERDLVKCTKTFIEVFNEEPWNDKWTIEKAERYLHDFYRTPGFIGILAMEDGEVLGFLFGIRRAWWSGDEFFIQEMCVKGDRQKRGIGNALLGRLEEELEAHSVTQLSLLTDRGIPAERFYKKNGFAEIERLVFLSKEIE